MKDDMHAKIIKLISSDCHITRTEMADVIGVSSKTIQREIKKMPTINYVGVGKNGHWEIVDVTDRD